MLSLHTNAAALSTQNAMGNTNKALSNSMTRLGTGLRVNSAMDDAAGLQIATRMNAQSRGMQVAQKNTQNGISMLQTAEGSMSEIGNMLLRMKDLATESASGTSSQADRDALQAEYGALGKEISNILSNTSFAGSTLFSENGSIGAAGELATRGGALGKTTGITFQVGATASETIEFKPGSDGSLDKLFKALAKVSTNIGSSTAATAYTVTGNDSTGTAIVTTSIDDDIEMINKKWADQTAASATFTNEAGFNAEQAAARARIDTFLANTPGAVLNDPRGNGTEIAAGNNTMITTINDAINAVGTFRSDLGAVANRLEHTFNNLGNMITNTDTAKGRIMDTDFAKESSNMTKNQMLMQVSTSMLKQSNSLSQMVGSLVQ